MKVRESSGKHHIVELEEDDQVQLLVPASMERTAVHLEVIIGKLVIAGGSSIVSEISGDGMQEKLDGFKDLETKLAQCIAERDSLLEKVNDLERQAKNMATRFDYFHFFVRSSLAIASEASIFNLRSEVKKAMAELDAAAEISARI